MSDDLEDDASRIARLESEVGALHERLAATQHRVRNTLAVIRSIARRSAETSESVETYAMHLDGRIGAFARVQGALLRDPDSGMALETLVADTLQSVLAREGDRLTIAGPSLVLHAKTAELLGLAFHELATNAVKYGSLAHGQGQVAVTWDVRSEERDTLILRWVETGGKMAPPRARRGFGMEFLENTLAYELDASTRCDRLRTGLACTIHLPHGWRLPTCSPA